MVLNTTGWPVIWATNQGSSRGDLELKSDVGNGVASMIGDDALRMIGLELAGKKG
jgi:hypothetical protein